MKLHWTILVSSALLLSIPAARAQTAGDHIDPAAGRSLAETFCASCHVVAPSSVRQRPAKGEAPDFSAIANDVTTTSMGLNVFLQSQHVAMPEVHLSRGQIDNLIDYILSLKGR